MDHPGGCRGTSGPGGYGGRWHHHASSKVQISLALETIIDMKARVNELC